MASGNATVDKLADIGLRHGEKAGVALAVMVFILCVGAALSQPPIGTTPEKVKSAAEAASTNLARNEDQDTILKRLEEKEKIKPTDFAVKVEEQIKVKLTGDTYKPQREWVTPEPGAGLIRDQPKLIAPGELYAYPGRGGLLVYALDEEGERIHAKEGEETEKKGQRYGNTRSRRSKGAMGGMMGGAMGKRKKARKSPEEIAREEEEERKLKQKRLSGQIVGGPAAETKSDAEDKDEGGPYKEITKGYRWVAITGTLDHAQMRAYYKEALKNPAVAHPQYLRLDLERRTLQEDGTWSPWQKVDENKNLEILDNLPANEEELAPTDVLPEGLVDPLPFLNAGLWEKVYIGSLIPAEKVEVKAPPKQSGMAGGNMMGGGSAGMMANQMNQMAQMQSSMAGAMKSQQQNQAGMMAMMTRGSGMGGMMGGGGPSEAAGNYWKSEEKRIMIRALDFTAQPNESYRYRVRIVVVNPNYHRDDVQPWVDKEKKTLAGPWSKETDVVTMPPDVEPYAIGHIDATAQSDTHVRFQVVSFNPVDGWTVTHNFDVGVGQFIGDARNQRVPRSDGSGVKSEKIDFTTRQLVMDVAGGGSQNLPAGMIGPPIDRPVMAALLRHDGSMAVHLQFDDVGNEFRKDIETNYDHELEQSNKKRKSSRGMGSAMMGGMGGMMGGGMMGGGRR